MCVSKKRPSTRHTIQSKIDHAYWLKRLFRNTFTFKGDRFQVNHWSVKIQHQGTRRTFSLKNQTRAKAAVEACKLYRAIVTEGWETVSIKGGSSSLPVSKTRRAVDGSSSTSYWAERLIYRKYTEKFHPHLQRELSVRVQHAGTSYYFPLQTDDPKVAARRAAGIYQSVTHEGWNKTKERFSRELSVAFRWVDNPVAWTYTTIQTQPHAFELPIAPGPSCSRLNVAVIETDPGIRRALAWCINQQPGYRCVASFATAAAALSQIPTRQIHLVLASQNLVDQGGTVGMLSTFAPKVAGLVFSVYEDCDLLFACAPGGAAGYLFRRTLPTRILEPIAEAWDKGVFTRDLVTTMVRHYFEGAVASLPASASNHELTNLTQRELEILGLLSKGQPDKEIADLLGISTWTVHGHLKKIFEKLDVHNRTEAVLKYLHK